MSRRFALAALTLIELTPPDLVSAAVDAGYDAVGLRLSPFRAGETQHPMLLVGGQKPPMLRETQARLRDSGLEVLDFEVMFLTAERDVRDFERVFEVGALLGARHALSLIDIKDPAHACAQFAALCEVAAPFGINCALEFTAWLGVGSVHAAREVVEAAGQTNGGVMLDPFHLFRSGGTVADIASIDPAWLRYAQFCDAPLAAPASLAEVSDEARFERLPPGEGGFPLKEFLQALPPGIPLGLEVPIRRLSATTAPTERARLALAGARRIAAPI